MATSERDCTASPAVVAHIAAGLADEAFRNEPVPPHSDKMRVESTVTVTVVNKLVPKENS